MLQLITTVLLFCTSSPQAGDSLHLFFMSRHHFGGWVPHSRMSCCIHMAQSSKHCPEIFLNLISKAMLFWCDEAVLLLAQIPTPAHPRCFDFQRQGGLCELRHRCPSPLYAASMPMTLGLPQLVLEGRVFSAGNSFLLNLKSNFQLNNINWQKRLSGAVQTSLPSI